MTPRKREGFTQLIPKHSAREFPGVPKLKSFSAGAGNNHSHIRASKDVHKQPATVSSIIRNAELGSFR